MTTSSPIDKAIVAVATLAVAVVTMAMGCLAAQPAAAATNCVAVVVDFRLLGGSVQTGCAQGDPSSGLQALSKAGFGYTPRPRDGLICQINARPACTDTTTSTYWSYWYRAAGSSHWVYATQGASAHNPKPGSTEGWVWQEGGRTPPPGTRAEIICPQLAATPSATPKPTKTKATSAPSTPSTKPATNATGAASGSTRRPTSATSKPSPKASSASVTPAASSATTSSPPASSATAAPPTDRPTSSDGAADDGGGGALGGLGGVALGGAVVLGIGAATVVRARRGRSP